MAKQAQNVVANVSVEAVAPPLSGYVEVAGALQPHRDDELVKSALNRLDKGEERLRKLLGNSARDEEVAEINAIKHPPKVYDLKDLEKRLRSSVKSLDSLLSSDVDPKVLADERAKHKSVEDLAAGLISLAESLHDAAVLSVAARVKNEVKHLKVAQSRVAAGGHAAFDEATSRLITELWCILDMGADVLGICLRNKGILEYRVYALSRTWKSPLRRQLSTRSALVPDSLKRGRPRGSKGKSKGKDGGAKNSPSGSGTPPNPPPSA